MAGINDLVPLALAFVLGGIVIAYGLDIVTDVQGDFTNTTSAYRTLGNVTSGMENMSSRLPTIGTIGGVAILLSVLLGAFAFKSSSGGGAI